MKQVAKMVCHGTYEVMFDDKVKYNPFKVYYTSGEGKKMIDKYADLGSAMAKLSNIAIMWGTIERM